MPEEAKENQEEQKPEEQANPRITIEIREGRVMFEVEGASRLLALGMLEDAKFALIAHYQNKAMEKAMSEAMNPRIVKPGSNFIGGVRNMLAKKH